MLFYSNLVAQFSIVIATKDVMDHVAVGHLFAPVHTIFPELKIRAVVRGSRILMMTAAKRLEGETPENRMSIGLLKCIIGTIQAQFDHIIKSNKSTSTH